MVDASATGRLLQTYMLEKALFEFEYELNYRPDWARIPLLGIVNMLRAEG